MKSLNIVFTGFFGAGNLGDEAILQSEIRGFSLRRPGTNFTVASFDPAAYRARGCEAIEARDLDALGKAISEADLLVVGGGGLWQDYWGYNPAELFSSEPYGIPFYARAPLMAAAAGVPFVLFANGVGPVQGREARRSVAALAGLAAAVSVRDVESARLLRDCGFSGQLTITSDPAFAMFPLAQATEPSRKAVRIGVVPRVWSHGVNALDILSAVGEAVGRVAKEQEAEVVLLRFQRSSPGTKEDDKTALDSVAESLRLEEHALRIISPATPAEAAMWLGSCDAVVTMRMHGAIFAAVGGVPSVAIAVDPKLEANARRLGLTELAVTLESCSAPTIELLLNKALEQKETLKNIIAAGVEEARIQLDSAFDIALGAVDKKPSVAIPRAIGSQSAGYPCMALRLPSSQEEARTAVSAASLWPASAIIAVATSSQYTELDKDSSLYGATLVASPDDSFGGFLRTAASAIASTAPSSADVIVVDATRFDIKAALSALKAAKSDNPEAALISAAGVTSAGSSLPDALEPDPGAARLARDLWDEFVGHLPGIETVSACGDDLARLAEQRMKPVVIAPVSPTLQMTEMTGLHRSALGATLLKQLADVNDRVRNSNGAIILLPSMSWKTHLFQRPHHLARQFAGLGFTTIYHSTYLQDELVGFREVEPNLFIFYGPEVLLHQIPDPLLWAFTYNYHHALDYPASVRVFYDVIDDVGVFSHNKSLIESNHSQALKDALFVATVSRPLHAQVSTLRPDAIYLPNAVESDHFTTDSLKKPDDPELAALLEENKPIAGYYGAFAEWFDYELLDDVAGMRPDWNFLLIGPIYDGSLQERGDGLLAHSNVFWIGARTYDELPRYLRLFDVATIPFVINNITLSASPLKLYEYFAGGKPVVATPMPECQNTPDVHIARDAEEFSRALDIAKAQGQDKRFRMRARALARENSWSARARTVMELLQSKPKINEASGRGLKGSDATPHQDSAALIGEQLAQLLSSQLAETYKVLQTRDNAVAWLSTRVAKLESIVQSREEAIEWLSTRVADAERDGRLLTTQTEELTTQTEELTTQVKEFTTQIEAKSELLQVQSTQLAELETSLAETQARLSEAKIENHRLESIAESMNAELNDMERQVSVQRGAIDALSAELSSQQERAVELATRIAQKDHEIDRRSKLLEEKAKIIADREDGITWLRGELELSQTRNNRLIGSNSILKMELTKNETAIKNLEQQLATTETELVKITRSLGWRLLSRYGRIKYRYLLPLYRKLNLLPAEPKASRRPAVAAQLPVDDAVRAAAIEPAPLVEAQQAGKYLSQIERLEESRESEQPDFYASLTLLPHLRREEVNAILDRRPPAEPLYRQDVVCFSIIDWEFRYQRPQQIMSQFASHGHRVFYISTTRFLSDDASPRVRVTEIKKNVYEVQLAGLRTPDVYGDVIDGDNKRAFLDSLAELRREYNINDAIGYVMIASWGALALEANRMWGWRTIYDCMDEWENFPGIKRDILDAELRLVQECDLLVVTAARLWEKWESYDRPMVLARNGVDIGFYDEHYHPNAILTDVQHPLIGYFGAIAEWFDLDLLIYAAKARPDYSFVLLGGVFNVDVSELETLSNVRVLGQQPYEAMPQYLYHFDVCMIPFKINPITEATDPVKLYEYLSAGKPVVSVALSEVVDYDEYLYLARDRNEFVLKLDEAVQEDDRDMVMRRRKFVEQHTWRQRYQAIEAGIKQITPRASVVVVSYNNLALNKLCLESLIRNTEYANYEIVVVDNDSKDATPAYLRYMAARYPNISIILNETNNGFARANNQGIARSNGEYIVLLNNDTIVPPGWLSRLLRHLEGDRVGLVGPLTNFVGNEAKLEVDYHNWGEMEELTTRHTWKHDGEAADIYMLAMFCVAFKRDIYEEIGPLDEQFGLGMFEDDDYAQRMKAKGFRVMCAADVFVHHFGQAAFKKLIENGSYDPLFDENRSYYETKWNVTWTPHRHAPLKFERLSHAPATRQAAEKKR